MTLLDRFNAKWEEAESGCWLWTGYVMKNGYGRIGVDGKHGSIRLAHRVSYELFVGEIPTGLDVDHVCHNNDAECAGGWECRHRRCVRPDHLAVVTRSANHKSSGRVGGLRHMNRDARGRWAVA